MIYGNDVLYGMMYWKYVLYVVVVVVIVVVVYVGASRTQVARVCDGLIKQECF